MPDVPVEEGRIMHGVTEWFCQTCGYQHGAMSAAAPVPACPRCSAVNWSTEPASGELCSCGNRVAHLNRDTGKCWSCGG